MKFQEIVVSGASGGNGFETLVLLRRLFPEAIIVGFTRNVSKAESLWRERREMLSFGNRDPVFTDDSSDVIDPDVWINFRGKSLSAQRENDPQLDQKAHERGLSVRDMVLKENLPMAAEDFKTFLKYAPNGNYVQQGNPVDPIVYWLAKQEQKAPHKIISTGAMMEWYRFLSLVAQEFEDISLLRATGLYIGGHGETAVPLHDRILFGAAYPHEYVRHVDPIHGEERLQRVYAEVANEAIQLSHRTGRTPYFGPSQVVADLVKMMVAPDKRHTIVGACTYHEEFDAAFSLPALIGPDGIIDTIPIELAEDVEQQLHTALESIRRANRLADEVMDSTT